MPQTCPHELVIRKMYAHFYDTPLIENARRGVYMESMVALALGESWRLTHDAERWDLEAVDSGARIEVRQKAAWQPAWDRSGLGRTYRTFEIPPHKSNEVDLYIFAWHSEADPDIADHRVPEQWRFYVVPERILPRQKTISIGRLRKRWPATTFGGLASTVNDVIDALPNLKAARPSC